MSKTLVNATSVREYFNADPKRLAGLSDKARKTVEKVDGKFPKGRLSPEAIKVHNKNRKTVTYEPGATARLRTEALDAAKALRAEAVAAGFAVGDRGPLPKAAREALASPKPPKRVRKSRAKAAVETPEVETPAEVADEVPSE